MWAALGLERGTSLIYEMIPRQRCHTLPTLCVKHTQCSVTHSTICNTTLCGRVFAKLIQHSHLIIHQCAVQDLFFLTGVLVFGQVWICQFKRVESNTYGSSSHQQTMRFPQFHEWRKETAADGILASLTLASNWP